MGLFVLPACVCDFDCLGVEVQEMTIDEAKKLLPPELKYPLPGYRYALCNDGGAD